MTYSSIGLVIDDADMCRSRRLGEFQAESHALIAAQLGKHQSLRKRNPTQLYRIHHSASSPPWAYSTVLRVDYDSTGLDTAFGSTSVRIHNVACLAFMVVLVRMKEILSAITL